MKPRAGKSKFIYFDVNEKEIGVGDWTKLLGNSDYRYITRYKGNKLAVDTEWLGRCDRDVWSEYRKLFKVTVFNLVMTGDRPGIFVIKRVDDPSLTKFFSTKELALAYYRQMLIDTKNAFMETEYSGEEVFTEINNEFSLKEEIVESTPDRPKSTRKISGSW